MKTTFFEKTLMFVLLLAASADIELAKLGFLSIKFSFSAARLSLILLSILCLAALFLYNYRPDKMAVSLVILVFATLTCFVVSALLSKCGANTSIKLVMRYATMALASLLAAAFLSTRSDGFESFLKAVVMVAVVNGAIGIFEGFNQDFAGSLAGIFREGSSVYAAGRVRSAGTMPHANIYSNLMVISIISCIYLYSKKYIKACLFYPGLIIPAAGLSFSVSRNAYLSLLIGLIIFVFNPSFRRNTIIAFLAVAVLFIALSPGKSRFGNFADTSSASRIELYKAAVKMFRDYPVTGVGPGCYNLKLAGYASEKLMKAEGQNILHASLNAHNGFFNVLAENGALGVVIVVILLVYMAAGIIKNFPGLPPAGEYGIISSVTLPFAFDAFFYSYFIMAVVLTVLFAAVLKKPE